MISGFRRDVNEICCLLRFYAALNGRSVSGVSGQPIAPILTGQAVQEDDVLGNA